MPQLAQVAALLLLLAAFLGLLLWLARPGAREAARRDAAIPFHEDEARPEARRDAE